MKAIYIIISVFFLVSCRQKDEHIKLTMESMMSSPVNLCLNEMHDQTLIPHKDKDLERADYKIIQYVDSFECAPCILDYLHVWNSLINDRRLENQKFSLHSSSLQVKRSWKMLICRCNRLE